MRHRPGYAPTYEVLDRSKTHQLMRDNGALAFSKLKSLVLAAG